MGIISKIEASKLCFRGPSLLGRVGDGGDSAVGPGEGGEDVAVAVGHGHRVDGEVVPGLTALDRGPGIVRMPE